MIKKIEKYQSFTILKIDNKQFPGIYNTKQTANYAFKLIKHKEKIQSLQEKLIQDSYNNNPNIDVSLFTKDKIITYQMLVNIEKEIIEERQANIDKIKQNKGNTEPVNKEEPQIEHEIKPFYDCNKCHQKVIFGKREKETNIIKTKLQGLNINNFGGSINIKCANCGHIIKIKGKAKPKECENCSLRIKETNNIE